MKACWNIFSDYADSCTIHGVKYLAEPKRPLWERICWIIAFIISIFFCGKLILNLWRKWEDIPVIVSFDEKVKPIWQIPFPSVTICPQAKSNSDMLNFTESYHKYNEAIEPVDDDFHWLQAVLQSCDYESGMLDTNFSYGEKYLDSEVVQFIRLIHPEYIFAYCNWKNEEEEDCDNMFTQTLTDVGVCYTFNIINNDQLYRTENLQQNYNYMGAANTSNEWSLENGYNDDASINPFPRRVLSANKRDSLQLILVSKVADSDYLCGGPILGYKISFQSPSEYPQFKKNYHYAFLDQQVSFTLIPEMVTTSKGLDNLSPIKRQCYYNRERQLKFFKIYDQGNCEIECLANYTLNKCGCVKFSMPSEPETPLCGTKSIECYTNAEYSLAQEQQEQILNKTYNKYNDLNNCNCLPSCTSIDYDVDVMQFDMNWDRLFEALKFNKSDILNFDAKFTMITINFKDVTFVPTKRSELYGTSDFIASCGGLLGLFMGVSLLSIVEIVYFATVRVFSNLRMKKKEKRQNRMKDNEETFRLKSNDSEKFNIE